MDKKKIPEDAVKSICPGYDGDECIECMHMKNPVALTLGDGCGRKWSFVTEEFLRKVIKKDGEFITGCFIKGCEFRQKLIRRDEGGVAKYHLT